MSCLKRHKNDEQVAPKCKKQLEEFQEARIDIQYQCIRANHIIMHLQNRSKKKTKALTINSKRFAESRARDCVLNRDQGRCYIGE